MLALLVVSCTAAHCKDTDDFMTLGFSGIMLVLGLLGALATAMLYGKDWLCNVVHTLVIKDHKGRVLGQSSMHSDVPL